MRVGIIIPSSNTTVEIEFSKVKSSITFHYCRLRLRDVNLEELEKMEDKIEEVSSLLSDASVDLICYACTTGSLYKGLKHEDEIVRRIEKASKIRAITTSRSVIEALKNLKVKRLSVATPYSNEVNLKVKNFLEENEFEIVKLRSLGLINNLDIGRLDPEVSYKLGKEAYSKDSEALFISCTNLRTFEIIQKLEDEIRSLLYLVIQQLYGLFLKT
ncbi:Maleate isomerase [archaeon HR06]|nr:Maleate isomerase [archaeon HR06]